MSDDLELFRHTDEDGDSFVVERKLDGSWGLYVKTNESYGVYLHTPESVRKLRDILNSFLGEDEPPTPAPLTATDVRAIARQVFQEQSEAPSLSAPISSSLTPPGLQLGEDPEEVWGTLCNACGHVSGIHTREGCGLVGCDCIRHAGQTNEPARIVNGVLDTEHERIVCGIVSEPPRNSCDLCGTPWGSSTTWCGACGAPLESDPKPCDIVSEPPKAKCTCHRHTHEHRHELFFCAHRDCYCRVVPK